MKNKEIVSAWDGVLPDEAARQRMLRRVTEYRAARGPRRRLWIPAAVGALVAAALAVWGGVQIHRFEQRPPAEEPPISAGSQTETASSASGTGTASSVKTTGPTWIETTGTSAVAATETSAVQTSAAATTAARKTTAAPTATVAPATEHTAAATQPPATETAPTETAPTETEPTDDTMWCMPVAPGPPQTPGDVTVTFENGDSLCFREGNSQPELNRPQNGSKARVVSGSEVKAHIPFLHTSSSASAIYEKDNTLHLGKLLYLKVGKADGVTLILDRTGTAVKPSPSRPHSTVMGVEVWAGYDTSYDSDAWFSGGYAHPPENENDLFTVFFSARFTLGELDVYAGISGRVEDCREMGEQLAGFIRKLIENGPPDLDTIRFNTQE